MAPRTSPKAAKKPSAKTAREDAPKDDVAAPDELPEWIIDARGKGLMTDEEVDFWIKSSGWTPIEFLTTVYRSPMQRMQDRINAAKSVLEYAHRKLPTKIELDGGVRQVKLDAAALSKLTDKELDALMKLLEKAS